jgi:aryl-alcohol dehydrogenase-like predicted oxidoreductase
MQYIRFGNAGIEVSRLALGCMDFTVKQDEATSQRILDTALDKGVNLLDTADTYGNGRSEEVLGRILKGKRDGIILATKFWANMYKRPNGGGCSRVHIIQALEDSLRRLGTDYVDLYQLHHPDSKTPVEETISTLDALVKQGKIRYYGVSNHYAWQMAYMLGVSALHNWEPLVSVQCRYNIIDRPIESEIVPFVQRFNIATMIYGPLNGGILAGAFPRGSALPEDTRVGSNKVYQAKLKEAFDLLDQLKEIADRNGIQMSQLAFAWLLSKPYVTTVLVGGSRAEHIEPIYGVDEIQVDPTDLARIDELSDQWRYIPFHNQRVVEGSPSALNRW